LLINRRIEGFHTAVMQVMPHLKNLAGLMQVNKSNKNDYLSNDTVIVAYGRRS
jgi:hypothetical protein